MTRVGSRLHRRPNALPYPQHNRNQSAHHTTANTATTTRGLSTARPTRSIHNLNLDLPTFFSLELRTIHAPLPLYKPSLPHNPPHHPPRRQAVPSPRPTYRPRGNYHGLVSKRYNPHPRLPRSSSQAPRLGSRRTFRQRDASWLAVFNGVITRHSRFTRAE